MTRALRGAIALAALAAALALPSSALAVGAPTATTEPASPIDATSAWFNGAFNNGGEQVTFHFDYATAAEFGTSGTYPHATPSEADNVFGVPWVVPLDESVSRAVSGLMPSTTYHVRFVAQNLSGTAVGQDVTFTTPAG